VTHGRLETGRHGEGLAVRHLEDAGLEVLARNWRCGLGEVDIVSREGDCLVFVEVRTRRSERYGTPEESIGRHKQAKLAAVATQYVESAGWAGPWRIDVVAIVLGARGRPAEVRHYRDAVGDL